MVICLMAFNEVYKFNFIFCDFSKKTRIPEDQKFVIGKSDDTNGPSSAVRFFSMFTYLAGKYNYSEENPRNDGELITKF